jgi:RNase P/RNase MRP subunit p29
MYGTLYTGIEGETEEETKEELKYSQDRKNAQYNRN